MLSFSLRSRVGAADIVLAASLWGTSGTARAFSALSPVLAGAAKALVGGLLLLILALRGGRMTTVFRHGGRTTWAVLGLGILCVAVFQTAFFAAVARTGVATGTVVTIGSAPVFAGILAFRKPSGRWLLATSGAVIGCALLVSGGKGAGVEPVGVGIALLSGLAYATYATITGRLIRQGADDLSVVGILFAGAALLLLPLFLATPVTPLFTPRALLVICYLGLVVTCVPYILYARGLRTTPVPIATTLGLAEPAVAAILGLVVLGEHLGTVALAGLALLASSLLLVR